MKNNLSKITRKFTIPFILFIGGIGVQTITSCSDLPALDDTPASSSSAGTVPSSSSGELSSSSVAASSSSSSSAEASSSSGLSLSSSSSAGASNSSSSGTAVSSSSGSVAEVKIWDGTADTTWYTRDKSKSAYLIKTAEELAGLALLVNGTANNGKYDMNGITIRLNSDIMLNDTTDWQNWEYESPTNSWTPIARDAYSFKGTFDGQGHVVSGIFYENRSTDYVGLFGIVNCEIKNIGVVAFYIYGSVYVGGLAGYMLTGQVSNSYSRGIAKGKSNVGGLLGANGGSTYNCYSTSTVSSDVADAGGLIGAATNNYGKIDNSYSTGKVSVGRSDGQKGGLVGTSFITTITSSYYDTQTSEQSDTGKGEPKTTAEMQTEEFAATLGTAFKYNAGGYPKLAWER